MLRCAGFSTNCIYSGFHPSHLLYLQLLIVLPLVALIPTMTLHIVRWQSLPANEQGMAATQILSTIILMVCQHIIPGCQRQRGFWQNWHVSTQYLVYSLFCSPYFLWPVCKNSHQKSSGGRLCYPTTQLFLKLEIVKVLQSCSVSDWN